MQQYIVSARKYRPSTFHSVVGQDNLTSTLKSAITNKQLAHAYLFCGPRGVGKTTCARIFAKSVNCMNPTDGEPCNKCASCEAFNSNGSFNIHELDAASNNSVDEIRSLIEQVRIPPSIGNYSVYIVDEVHMLSKAAFNAFLKTLEEPPAHVLFILATTEHHKILPTILSRCQVYNFNRIKVSDTVKYLQYVASQENITAEHGALTVVAQKADGAMRDALSIFDQLVSFCGNNITYENAIQHLNVLDYEYYFRITDCLLNFKVKDSLLILDEILNKGFDAQYFVSGLANHFRNLLVSKDSQTRKLLDVSPDIEQKYIEQNIKCTNTFIYKALELSNECDYNYRLSRNKRLLVELLLIKLCGLTQQNSDSKKDRPNLPKIQVATVSDVKQSATATENAIQESTTNKTVRFSIFGKNKTEVQETSTVGTIETTTIADNIPLNEDSLRTAWTAYAKAIEKDAHTMNTMNNFLPIITSENSIKVILANSMQREAINTHKNNIIAYLSKHLQNNNITIEIEVGQSSIYAKEAFTPYEKLAQMTTKNPDFKLLKEKLQLEI